MSKFQSSFLLQLPFLFLCLTKIFSYCLERQNEINLYQKSFRRKKNLLKVFRFHHLTRWRLFFNKIFPLTTAAYCHAVLIASFIETKKDEREKNEFKLKLVFISILPRVKTQKCTQKKYYQKKRKTLRLEKWQKMRWHNGKIMMHVMSTYLTKYTNE